MASELNCGFATNNAPTNANSTIPHSNEDATSPIINTDIIIAKNGDNLFSILASEIFR